MNNNSKTILIVILILLIPVGLGIGGYFLYKKVSKTNPNPDDNTANENGDKSSIPSGSGYSENPNSHFPLVKNSHVKSDLVKELQELLNERIGGLQAPMVPYYKGAVIQSLSTDGYYGDKTAAVVKFIFGNDGKSVTEQEFNSLKYPTNYNLFKI